MKTRTVVVPNHHIVNALDGYLKAVSIINDDDVVISFARNPRTGDYSVEVEKE